MKMSRALVGVVLVGAALAGCGGGDDGAGSAYCKDLKTAKATFSNVGSGGVAQLEKAFSTFHDLADEAPSDVKDDWNKLDGAITKLEKALDDAGVKLSELAGLTSGQVPKGVDVNKLKSALTELNSLNSAGFRDASTAIEKHAKDVCKVDLN